MQLRPLCTSEISVKGSSLEGEAHPIRCKRWSCTVCREINRAKVIRIARAAKPRALLTLTVRSSDYATPEAAAHALKEGLRLLRLRLKRHPKLQNFEFLAVFERHKSGYPHLHLLIRGSFIPWQWLRTAWQDITGSYMVDIRKISTEGLAAMYCAKYIGKDLSPFEGCKRWWRSRNYSEEDVDQYVPPHWSERPTRYFAEYFAFSMALKLQGFIVEKVGREGIRWRAPPDGELSLPYALYGAHARPVHDRLGRS